MDDDRSPYPVDVETVQPDGKPALFIRAVTRIFQVKLVVVIGQRPADSVGDLVRSF